MKTILMFLSALELETSKSFFGKPKVLGLSEKRF
jgi:hypothetical protein